LIQLPRVCSTTPRLRAAAASVWPDSTPAARWQEDLGPGARSKFFCRGTQL
jgi:hypothetical protein